MNRRLALPLLAALLAALVWWTASGSRPAPPDHRPEPALKARVTRAEGLTVVRLRGAPRARAREFGARLGQSIRDWLERLRPREPGLREFALRTCGRRLLPALPDRLRDELAGLAEGAGITIEEAVYLNARFELAAFGLVEGAAREPGFAGPAATGPGPVALRVFRDADLHGRSCDLVAVVYEDLDPPLVLVALPGMLGGFIGLRGDTAAAARPMQTTPATPSLAGPGWTLLLRLLLESPPHPGKPLPARPSLPLSVAMTLPGGGAGTLNAGPAGAIWLRFGAGAWALANEEPPGEAGEALREGEALESLREAAKRRTGLIRESSPGTGAVTVRLAGRGDGVEFSLSSAAGVRRMTVKYRE